MTRSLFFLLLCSTTLFAQANLTTDEILKAEKAWVAAATANDQAALGKLFSGDLVYTHATGIVEGKAEYLKALQSFQKYKSIEHIDPKIRAYGTTGVVSSKVRMQGSTRGTPFDNTVLMLHVWARQDGRLQLVAHQTTRIP
ncbi:MAG: nuclear transport factor 2 family protein [Bryobacteraceae bacterium]